MNVFVLLQTDLMITRFCADCRWIGTFFTGVTMLGPANKWFNPDDDIIAITKLGPGKK